MRPGTKLIIALLFAAGCGTEVVDPVIDAGPPQDVGFIEASVLDAGLHDSSTPDARPIDAGPERDAAPVHDAGSADAGQADAGHPDASTPDTGPAPAPELYSGHTMVSPITPYVLDRLRTIAAVDPTRADDVFMKVGASGTVSTHLLYCFAGAPQPQYTLDLAGRTDLMEVIDHFRAGAAAGTTPFDRPTEAAVSGRSAVWAITGNPSPLEREIAAINPGFALINYGTNDMQRGTTPSSALPPFYSNFTQLVDQTIDAGIVPIITGLNPRTDSITAARWVRTYNTVTRGVAQARQVPYINMYLAAKDLPSSGLVGDGLHGNVFRMNGAEPCVFTADALQFNYNVRNLLTISTFGRVFDGVVRGLHAPDPSVATLAGAGSLADPFQIDELPFAHVADTSASPNASIDGYPSCDAGQDESGPELIYRLSLAAQSRLRMVVLDGGGVDIDVHLLSGTAGAPTDCVARHDRVIQGTFDAGDYLVVLDTYVSGTPRSGEYLLAIVECDAGDPDCD